jgi:hypothetical protein
MLNYNKNNSQEKFILKPTNRICFQVKAPKQQIHGSGRGGNKFSLKLRKTGKSPKRKQKSPLFWNVSGVESIFQM